MSAIASNRFDLSSLLRRRTVVTLSSRLKRQGIAEATDPQQACIIEICRRRKAPMAYRGAFPPADVSPIALRLPENITRMSDRAQEGSNPCATITTGEIFRAAVWSMRQYLGHGSCEYADLSIAFPANVRC